MMQAAVPEQNDVAQEDEMLVDEENDVITYQSMQPFNLVVSVSSCPNFNPLSTIAVKSTVCL
jgi:hypothetical protein